jgi:hypothetical protein
MASTQTQQQLALKETPSSISGGHGALSTPFSHLLASLVFAAQVTISQSLTLFRLALGNTGCYRSFGIQCSGVSAEFFPDSQFLYCAAEWIKASNIGQVSTEQSLVTASFFKALHCSVFFHGLRLNSSPQHQRTKRTPIPNLWTKSKKIHRSIDYPMRT